ncbi:hypothetical protein BKA66DRAFT_598170 [Pyrenochaeta sp. MPI-SDFR-AT-0127]|nr:hypothetical protein BKA66DRAFT_598170 [Pyrenochaeta sp. MPI-SDFR-AT-0127]
MSAMWISVSTRWGITSVQAALNVFISVIGTIGVWTFSRYWWQRGTTKVLNGKIEVPLSALLSLASLGEGYDAVKVLRRRMFAKDNWRLLLQVVIIFMVTLACMFAGPIAKVSLRTTQTVQVKEVEVLQATNGEGFIGNRLGAYIEWNDTIQSLNNAGFPYDQILEYQPPVTKPWVYATQEWNPIWRAACELHDEDLLQNVTASGNGTFDQPLDAFPAFRATYDSAWLNFSENRIERGFSFEYTYTRNHGTIVKDAIFWILIQSDPVVNDRMYFNNDTLKVSVSAFHAKNFSVSLENEDTTQGLSKTWRPSGPVQNASYSRFECVITRKTDVLDESTVPWIWTNDTWSLNEAYTKFWMSELGKQSSKNQIVIVPNPQTLFRLYQAYMVSVNTWLSQPSTRKLSVWMTTVQLSTACLVMLLLLVLLELWLTGHYWWFLRRNKQELDNKCIPDGKVDWMIYNARLAEQGTTVAQNSVGAKKPSKDRDFLRRASLGTDQNLESNQKGLARIYTSPGSTIMASPGKHRNGFGDHVLKQNSPTLMVEIGKQACPGNEKNSGRVTADSGPVDLFTDVEPVVSQDYLSPHLITQGPILPQEDDTLKRSLSHTSSMTMAKSSSICQVTSPKSSLHSMVLTKGDTETVRPIESQDRVSSQQDSLQMETSKIPRSP